MKNSKKIISISLFIATLLIIGSSFALWQINLQQETTNVITTACFKITFQDTNPIGLMNAYPLPEEEGKKLTPYTFTIENVCDSAASYQVNLEELAVGSKRLQNQYIKVSINKEKGETLNVYPETTPTLNEADRSHTITTGVLKAKSIKKYDINLWLDEDTPLKEEVIQATFKGKITISATYRENAPEVNILAKEDQDGIKIEVNEETENKENLIYFYQLEENEAIESLESTYRFGGLMDGSYKVKAQVKDSNNILIEEQEFVLSIAYEKVFISNNGNDEVGNGAEENPYASIKKAYQKVKSGGEIILLNNITAAETANLNTENKEVILKSNESNNYTVTRKSSLTTSILNITNHNTFTTTNVTFDGNNVNANESLIFSNSSTLYLNNTILKNNENALPTQGQGGALRFISSTVNLTGTTVTNNKVTSYTLAQGGGIYSDSSTVNIQNSSILNNSCNYDGGGIYGWDSVIKIANSKINGNVSKNNGGGIFMSGATKNISVTFESGQIMNNKASTWGGGLYIQKRSGSSLI